MMIKTTEMGNERNVKQCQAVYLDRLTADNTIASELTVSPLEWMKKLILILTERYT